MTRKPELTIWGGVIKALENCQRSESPLATLAEYLEKLKEMHWHPSDVQLVERCTLELFVHYRQQQIAERKAQTTCSSVIHAGGFSPPSLHSGSFQPGP